MYEGTLPNTGAAAGVAGLALGMSWLIAIGLAIVIAGILVTRYSRSRARS